MPSPSASAIRPVPRSRIVRRIRPSCVSARIPIVPAALEGSSPLRSFFSITLPQILPPFVPLLISSFAFNFNNVVIILLLTRGAPDIPGTLIPAGQTDSLGSFTFRMSFQDAGQSFGIAGAISTMIFLLVGILAYANFFALRKAAEARGRG